LKAQAEKEYWPRNLFSGLGISSTLITENKWATGPNTA